MVSHRKQKYSFSGDLTNPRDMAGGLIFEKGSHKLPPDDLVQEYDNDVEGFIQRAVTFGGEQLNYGDASAGLFPFPKAPVILIMWRSDEEFPSDADMLFDSTCSQHLPADMIWSTAMVSILVMLNSDSTQARNVGRVYALGTPSLHVVNGDCCRTRPGIRHMVY